MRFLVVFVLVPVFVFRIQHYQPFGKMMDLLLSSSEEAFEPEPQWKWRVEPADQLMMMMIMTLQTFD